MASRVDDWSDGYTSDYLRDLNTYGPASANVPRPSSVVSHQVRYRAPDTSDIPLAPGQNPEGSVYSNASGARMGQLKPRSGYNPPAGGGWDVNSSDTNLRFSNESGGKQYRVSRTQATKKTGKKQAQPDKKQPQPEYRTGGARTPEENEIARSAAEHRTGADLGQLSSQALDAAARFLPALKLLGFGAGAGSASVPETNFNRGLMGGVGRQVESMRAPDSEQPAPESSSIEGQFKNTPWYKDAKAHHEAVKKNMDDYGSALGTLKSTWDDIPWWTKLVMLPPVFKAGSPAAGASTTGNVWTEGSRAAAGDATAGTKAFEESLSRMNGGAVRGAPTESFAQPAASASAGWRTGRTAEYPAGTGKFDQFGGWGESGRSAVGTGSAPASDGVARFADTGYGSVGQGAAKTTSTEVAGAGADTGAASAREIMFGADAGAASRTAAGTADGGVSELANAGNVGRETAAGGAAARQGAGEAAGALAPQLQRDLSAVRQKVLSEGDSFERIRDVLRTSGGRQELLPANIREACEPLRRIVEQGGGAALTPAEREAVQLYISKSVAPGAAGAAGRGAAAAGGQAAGTAGREAAAAGGQAALNKIPEELRAEISAQRKALTAANIKPSDMLNEISEAMDTGYLSGTTYEVGRKLLQAVQAGGGEVLSAGERSIAEAYSKFLQTPKGRIYREDLNW